jgi:hypothetical protein
MVLGIFFLIVFLIIASIIWRMERGQKFLHKLCASVGCSFVITALIVFGAAKELASLKFLFS